MAFLHDAPTMDSDGSIHHPLLAEYIQHGLNNFEREEKRSNYKFECQVKANQNGFFSTRTHPVTIDTLVSGIKVTDTWRETAPTIG